MEDSGIDSGDKELKSKFMNEDSESSSNENEEVIFRGLSTSSSYSQIKPISSNSSTVQNDKEALVKVSSCRVLQRKLEQKVERAKRNYRHLQQRDDSVEPDVFISQPKSTNLIPINRLQFPGCEENQMLIKYKDAGEEDEPDEDGKFFSNAKAKKAVKLDLSDTFSIQEMTIESDTEGSESDTLELLPPIDQKFWDKATAIFCCAFRSQDE